MLNNVAGLLGGITPDLGAFEFIQGTTVGAGGTASVTFGSGGTIPQTYKHLQIRAISRVNGGSSNYNGSFKVNFNSDTGSNYNGHQLYGIGSGSAGAGVPTGSNPVAAIWLTSGSAQFAGHVIDILDYSNTNKYTTLRHLGGSDNNGGGAIVLESGAWRSTSAVTSISLAYDGVNINQYSSFALYGIKG